MSSADWDMTPYFPAHDSSEFRDFLAALSTDVGELSQSLASAAELAPANVSEWASHLARLEDISARLEHVSSYLGCMGAADARDSAIKSDSAKLATLDASVEKLYVAVRAALQQASTEVFDRLVSAPKLEGARHFLDRQRTLARRAMPAELEELAADLSVDGLHAWSRLYDQISGTLTFSLEVPGKDSREVPVAMTRTLLEDADSDVRAAASAGSAAAWESVAESVAACLNAISGTRLALYRRRAIDHFLQPALHDAAIERRTLDCMFDTVRQRQDMPRAFLRAKAQQMGLERLRFCDLMAPAPREGGSERIPWDRGRSTVEKAFSSAYPALGSFASMALDKRWVDHSPRDGKRPGGFCSGSQVLGESRIFMTYNGAPGDVQTLAHELGHAFHSWLMRDQRLWECAYPMTLAETASTFAENVVTNAQLAAGGTTDADRISILDTRLQHTCAFLLNIPMRFDFEYELYERRDAGELSVEQLCEMMRRAQQANYGDALDPESLDPWFWASKLHFYITDLSFYNFPYTFGYLFSMGLVARFLDEGAAFLPRYERLLRRTGSASAEELARDQLGVDLGEPDFWSASIDLVEKDWDELKKLWS